MKKIDKHDVLVGDTIEVVATSPGGTVSKTRFVVQKLPLLNSNWEVDGVTIFTPRGWHEAIFLVDRKPSLAREMLDLYCSFDDSGMNRAKRMHALVEKLKLVKAE